MGRDRSRSRGGEEDRIQKLVDERQQCRRDRDFDRADRLREELRDMGVNVDDTALSWRGPGGLEGSVGGGFNSRGGGGAGIERRDGDWDCPKCGAMVFASKDQCFKCGAERSGGGGRDRDDRRGGGRYDDRSPPRRNRRDDFDDRRGGGRYDDHSPPRRSRRDDYDDRRGGGRYDDRSPPRRSSRYDDYDDRRGGGRSSRYDDYDRRR